MKRIRLDIGAFTASSEEGGKFLFFLYKEKMDRCLSVGLTPPQMHSVLTVFKNGEKEQIVAFIELNERITPEQTLKIRQWLSIRLKSTEIKVITDLL